MSQDPFTNLLRLYDYRLPPELIAQKPVHPRDAARLLVYSKHEKKISFDIFSNLGKYLPRNSVLVFNQTKVVPARLTVTKPTGGKAEILYLGRNKHLVKAIANRELPAGKSITLISTRVLGLKFKVISKKDTVYLLRPNFPVSQIPHILQKFGKTPLPPYIKHSPLTEKQRRQEYQSVFAKQGLSIAAPTASLHFTNKLTANLKRQGISTKFVRLDVNLGTFAPLKKENVSSSKLHSESYSIDTRTARVLNLAKRQGKPIIAVGTTVVRTLESAAVKHELKNLSGNTRLFINPGYKFKFCDGMITNFHVPKSSLMMLAAALIGRKQLIKTYQQAIKKRFRFFSFGDGMLIIP